MRRKKHNGDEEQETDDKQFDAHTEQYIKKALSGSFGERPQQPTLHKFLRGGMFCPPPFCSFAFICLLTMVRPGTNVL
jgi:hypothetical protein